MNGWKVVVMEGDDPSKEIYEYFSRRWQGEILRREVRRTPNSQGPSCLNRIHYKHTDVMKATSVFDDIDGRVLTLYGHGNTHHYTFGLCSSLMKKRSPEYLYVHIDQHTDSGTNYKEPNGDIALGCGSFVKELKMVGAREFLYLGCRAFRSGPRTISQNKLMGKGWQQEIETALGRKKYKNAYVSMDLDVMDIKEIATCYDRGKLTLEHVLNILKVLKNNLNIMSADILGYCGGGSYDVTRYRDKIPKYKDISMMTYAILATELIGGSYEDLLNHRSFLMKETKAEEVEY